LDGGGVEGSGAINCFAKARSVRCCKNVEGSSENAAIAKNSAGRYHRTRSRMAGDRTNNRFGTVRVDDTPPKPKGSVIDTLRSLLDRTIARTIFAHCNRCHSGGVARGATAEMPAIAAPEAEDRV